MLVALLGATVAGCSSGRTVAQSTADRGSGVAAPNEASDSAAKAAGASPNAASGQAPIDQPVQRSVIYTGSIALRVNDVPSTATTIGALVVGTGGYLSGDQRQLSDGRSTATLTLRVPAEKFTATMNAIRTKGHEENEDVSSQDVTGTVIDLAARIRAQQASVNRVRDLLAKAQSITDVTTIESELARREADLEAMQAKQTNLTDLAALSTITVQILGPDATVIPKQDNRGFLAGLKQGWHAFATTLGVLLTVLGATLPFLVVLGIPLLIAYRWLRQRRRATPAGTPADTA